MARETVGLFASEGAWLHRRVDGCCRDGARPESRTRAREWQGITWTFLGEDHRSKSRTFVRCTWVIMRVSNR